METKIPKFCKSCGKRLMYNSNNGSENNGWNRIEHSSFNEFTGKRIGPKYSYQINLYCSTWNEFWHIFPRPMYNSPSNMGHTCRLYNSSKMFDLKKYGVIPTVYKEEDDIIDDLPRKQYIETHCKPKKKFLGII